jgi:glycosyltransferase involved in cell wall biosynthesis
MSTLAHDRGAAVSNLFVIPEPLETRTLVADADWAASHGIDLDYHAVIFADAGRGGMKPVLHAFASILSELEQALLVFELGDLDRGNILNMAREFEVADNIRCIGAEERNQALACSNLVLVAGHSEDRTANPFLLQAMASGKAVVAADVDTNRECSRDGRGVIWYREGDVQDMAQRTAFVARNADFSRTLGDSGREHIQATRSAQAVGRLYDEVYQHVYSRRRDNLPRIPAPKLYEARLRA